MINIQAAARMGRWQLAVSFLLLSATMINYMDRQTLSILSVRIQDQFHLTSKQYGMIEETFSYAFAFGSLFWGVLADILPVRYLYPFVLVAWSAVGFATGLTGGFESLYYCRLALGFFESGHWPCALVVTHSILTSTDRPLANSILQSGASIGSILTPLVIVAMVPLLQPGQTPEPDAWRLPFLVIGSIGLVWVLAWFMVVKRDSIHQVSRAGGGNGPADLGLFVFRLIVNRKFWALVLMVASINITWQMLRPGCPCFCRRDADTVKRRL